MNLAGKVVLITGASTGIGEACARAFARRGARLILTARSAQALQNVRRAVVPAEAQVIPADLSRPEQVAALVERAAACYGRVDVLVNNAGVGLYQSCWRADPALAREMLEVNLLAPLALIRGLAPQMRQQGSGMIINVSSVAGKVALPWLTLYSASKAALNFLSDGLRMELEGTGVRVLAVCPGYVSTSFHEHALGGRIPQVLARRRRFTITAEECAEAIVRGMRQEKRTVVTPRITWALVAAARLLPGLTHRLLARLRGPEQE